MSTINLPHLVAPPSNKLRNALPQRINSLLYALFLIPLAAVFPLYYLSMDVDKRDNPVYHTAFEPLPGVGPRLLISLLVTPIYLLLFLAEMIVLTVPLSLFSERFNSLFQLSMMDWLTVGMMLSFPVLILVSIVIFSNLHLWSAGKDLHRRLILTFIFAILFLNPAVPLAIVFDFQLGMWLTGGAAIFYIGLATNGYIVKTDDALERQTSQSTDTNFSELHVDPDQGEEVADSKAEAMIERIEQQKWDALDDLQARATIAFTGSFRPLRVIHRFLVIDEQKISKEDPKPTFREKKQGLRTDVSNIESNAPEEFSNQTYRYLLPNSVDSHQCTTCHGEGQTTCADCRGRGKQQCGRCDGNQVETCQKCGTAGSLRCGDCGGDGERTCPKCSGSEVVRKKVSCGVCNGSGETQKGFECPKCGGHGKIKKDRRCSNCRNGIVSCSHCNGTGSVTCTNCQGKAGNPCRNCNGSGTLTCSTCSGSGQTTCSDCAGSGTRIAYEIFEREYKSLEETKYKNKSIPERLISNSDGEVERLQTTEDTEKEEIYRKQIEVQSIPVIATIYKYDGNFWEAFTVNEALRTVDYPRDFDSQFGVVCGFTLLTFLIFVVARVISPMAPPI